MTDETLETMDATRVGPADDNWSVGGAGDVGGGPGGGRRSGLGWANLVIAGLLVAGGCVVYALSLRKGPAKASALEKSAEAKVDGALMRMTPLPGKASASPSAGRFTESVIRDFRDRIVRCQVPISGLSKDPFVVVPAAPAEPGRPGRAPTPQGLAPGAAAASAMVDFRTLHLQSVMEGASGAYALISNNVVTAGQQVKGFRLERIDPKARSVLLSRGGKTYTLRMSR